MSLDICSTNHDEICYDGYKCPICPVIEEKDDEIENLKRGLKLDFIPSLGQMVIDMQSIWKIIEPPEPKSVIDGTAKEYVRAFFRTWTKPMEVFTKSTQKQFNGRI